MRTIGSREQRLIEEEAVRAGIPTLELMERAAQAVTTTTLRCCADKHLTRVSVLCGMGNNGGDGYAAARLLWGKVPQLTVYELETSAERCAGDARLNREACLRLGIQPVLWEAFRPVPGVIIDAIFGSGFRADRPLTQEFVRITETVAEARRVQNAYVVSVDLPSGVEASSGRAAAQAIIADETVSFFLPKTGLVCYPGRKYAGQITTDDLGLPPEWIGKVWDQNALNTPSALTAMEVRGFRPNRPVDSHKGTYGRLAVLAGSTGMAGAGILSGLAAARSGTGYVRMSVPASIFIAVLKAAPSLLITELPEKNTPCETATAQSAYWSDQLKKGDAVLVGPGLGKPDAHRPDLTGLVLGSIRDARRLVLDADALNLIARPEILEEGRQALRQRALDGFEPALLTPHPLEFQRLCPESADKVFEERLASAQELAHLTQSVVVLKGAGTVVVLPRGGDDFETWINTSGNAGMAKAGSGDVLSGILGGFLAQGLDLRAAVLSAVYLHGLAGDLRSRLLTERALLPEDILAGLPDAFFDVGWDK